MARRRLRGPLVVVAAAGAFVVVAGSMGSFPPQSIVRDRFPVLPELLFAILQVVLLEDRANVVVPAAAIVVNVEDVSAAAAAAAAFVAFVAI